jgi:hypothetical protein
MAGFGRNGSRSSAKAIASAERHGEWLRLRREGFLEREIGSRYGVKQQTVSKAILKHVRDVPAGEAKLLRRTHAAYLASMYEMVSQAYERAQSDKVLLKFISMALDLMEREAKLLGLDAEMRNHVERPVSAPHRGTVFDLLAQVEPLSVKMLKQIQELDPIKKPDHAKGADGPGPVDD